MAETHYDVLEVSPKASPEMVKKAYRLLLTVHHPDRGGDPEKTKALTYAYATLSDPEKRREYDAELAREAAPPPVEDPHDSPKEGEAEHHEPVVDWGEEVPVEEPVVEDPPQSPRPTPQFHYYEPKPTPNPFPWEAGGMPPPPAPTPTGKVPKRPLVNWIAGGSLVVLTVLPILLSAFTSDGVVGNVLCSGIGLAIGWAAGRRRAAGDPLGAGYVIYVTALITLTVFGFILLSGDWPVVTMTYPLLWVASYVLFVESSCIWRRKVYWAQA